MKNEMNEKWRILTLKLSEKHVWILYFSKDFFQKTNILYQNKNTNQVKRFISRTCVFLEIIYSGDIIC